MLNWLMILALYLVIGLLVATMSAAAFQKIKKRSAFDLGGRWAYVIITLVWPVVVVLSIRAAVTSEDES